MPSAFDEEIKLLEKWKKRDPRIHRAYADWRRKWRIKGPVAFAHEILRKDPNTGSDLVLSDDQIEFLLDLAKRGIRLAIITAGRGAGKTFVLAVYITWRIFTHEFWGISSMGGSAEQSEKIRVYIAKWIADNKELREYCVGKPTVKKVSTYANSYVSFHSCSATSVRGPHTHELIIDEQAAGEETGGTKQIKAAIFQVSTSPDIHIIKSSTAQFIHGDFLHTWNNAKKLGYKTYNWAIAKHISGEKDPYKVFQDHNPDNWLSNVPWIPDRNIKILRNDRSNDEWLVEALGGISKASGLVFSPPDLQACICDRCPAEFGQPCQPYKEGYCPIVQMQMQLEGVEPKKISHSTREALHRVGQRILGIDWGKNAPCAYTVTGKFRRVVFVLHSEEVVGLTDDEKIGKASGTWKTIAVESKLLKRPITKEILIKKGLGQKWNLEIVRPDPREWSFNNAIAGRGFAVHQLFTFARADKEKNEYLHTIKKFVERHQLIIPCAFEDLIRSLKNLAYDDQGRIRKSDDHSFDSLLYAISYYGEIEGQSAFWEAMKSTSTGAGAVIVKTEEPLKEEKGIKRVDKDVFIIEDWEAWIKKKKWEKEKEGEEDDEEFPWGEGVNLW